MDDSASRLGVSHQSFVEALRHLVERSPPDALRDRLGRYAGELTCLVPEVSDFVPELPSPSDPETEQYGLFDAVAACWGLCPPKNQS
jgi:hypothetical protein